MKRCEDERMWRWDVKMSERMWRWDVKMRGCKDEKMWRWEDVKMRCEDERMWRWDVKMRRCFSDPHYWKNPALRRSREKLVSVVASSPHDTWNCPGHNTLYIYIYIYYHHYMPKKWFRWLVEKPTFWGVKMEHPQFSNHWAHMFVG